MAAEETGETGGPCRICVGRVCALPALQFILDALVVAKGTTKEDRCEGIAWIPVADDWFQNVLM